MLKISYLLTKLLQKCCKINIMYFSITFYEGKECILEKLSKDNDSKYAGIYINRLKNGTVSYYISFRDENNKVVKLKIGISPDMTKTKALSELNDKKSAVKKIKEALRSGEIIPSLNKNKKVNQVYTLNDLADFYIKDNNEIKTTKDITVKYNYHVKNEAFASKPIQLITRDDLVDFVKRKKFQRSDKRRYLQEGRTIEEKELDELYKNNEQIEKLQKLIKNKKSVDIWREENKIKYFEKKNKILEIRIDEKLSNKVLNDSALTMDERRYILGLLAHKTIKEILLLCLTMINYAIFEKKLSILNPFIISKKDKKLYINVDNVRDRFLTKDELKVFLEEVKEVSYSQPKHKNIYLMVLLGLSLATRQGSLLSIKIGDIDLENRQINLRNFKSEKSYLGFIGTDEVREEIIKLVGNRDDQDDYLFINRTGKKPYRYPRKILEILDYTVNYKRAYFKWLSLKDLRNTAASHLAINGVPIQYISKILNHSDLTTTQRYAHLSKNSGEQEITDMMSSFMP